MIERELPIVIAVVVTLGLVAGMTGIAAAGGSDTKTNGDNKYDKKTGKEKPKKGGSDKVTICHVPPGNPDNPQTITISENAVESHLANHPGDHIGPCEKNSK